MRTRTVEKKDQYGRVLRSAVAYLPDEQDVDAVAAGGQAPSCFGGVGLVTKVNYRGVCTHPSRAGARFVGYTVAMGPRDTLENGCGCTASMTAGELVRSVALSGLLDSAKCDELERKMAREVAS